MKTEFIIKKVVASPDLPDVLVYSAETTNWETNAHFSVSQINNFFEISDTVERRYLTDGDRDDLKNLCAAHFKSEGEI